MVRSKEYSSDLRSVVVRMYSNGLSFRKIASLTGLPKSSLHFILKKFHDEGSVDIAHRFVN